MILSGAFCFSVIVYKSCFDSCCLFSLRKIDGMWFLERTRKLLVSLLLMVNVPAFESAYFESIPL